MIEMPAAARGGVYGDGVSISQPSIIAPAWCISSATPAAPEPAMPMTWMRSPGLTIGAGASRRVWSCGQDLGQGELQGCQRGGSLVALAIVAKEAMLRARRVAPKRHATPVRADRLALAPTLRTRHAGDAQPELGAEALTHAIGHGLRDLCRDGAMLLHQRDGHAHLDLLGPVRVADHATRKVV